MSGERRNQPEQEISIRRRGHELFVEESTRTTTSPARPFSEFLRETPAAPIPTWVKASLWAAGIVAALLFIAALWRLINRPTTAAAPRRARAGAAARIPRTPLVADRLPTPIDQEPRG